MKAKRQTSRGCQSKEFNKENKIGQRERKKRCLLEEVQTSCLLLTLAVGASVFSAGALLC